MEDTAISWCDHTFNPWQGCGAVSSGCKNCYAEAVFRGAWGPKGPRPRTGESYWRQPVIWNRKAEASQRPRSVFVGSMCDWAESRDDEQRSAIADLWPLIAATPWLKWLLLTKRPQNIPGLLPGDWGKGYPNVMLGTSIESGLPKHKDAHLGAPVIERARQLVHVPAAAYFVSYEPALGDLADELEKYLVPWRTTPPIDWVIFGGESGPRRRPMGPSGDRQLWAREMMEACKAAGTAFFYKQSGDLRPGADPFLDGERIQELPAFLTDIPPTVIEKPRQGSLFEEMTT